MYFCKVFLEFIYNVYRWIGRNFSLTNYLSVSSALESDGRDAPVIQISLLCPSRLLLEFSIQHLRIREHFENKDFVTIFLFRWCLHCYQLGVTECVHGICILLLAPSSHRHSVPMSLQRQRFRSLH